MNETKVYKTLNISLQSKRYTIVQDIINSWDDNLTKSEVVCEDILAMYKIKQIPCLKDIVNLIIFPLLMAYKYYLMPLINQLSIIFKISILKIQK